MPRKQPSTVQVTKQPNQISASGGQNYLVRQMPLWSNPQWLNADVWREFVRRQPIAVLCREAITNYLVSLDWKITSRDSEKQDELKVLADIADKIRHVYCTAYELASVSDGQQAALANAFSQLAQSALRDSMGAGTRRLLVRTTVEYLDRFREDGKLADLSAAAADSMSKQCGEELDTAAVKFQSSDGE